MRCTVIVGLTVAGLCAFALQAATNSARLERHTDRIDVFIAGKPFTTYYFSPDVAKPYLMPLRSSSGLIVSRDYPVGNAVTETQSKERSFEPHQRPLYFGHGNLNGLDFWEEPVFQKYYDDHPRQPYGRMVVETVTELPPDGNGAGIQARFRLVDTNNRVVGEETQIFRFRGGGNTRTIDCEFVIVASAGPITMGDTKEGTFGVRLCRQLSAPLVRMTNSSGAEGERAIWGKPADWVEYSGVISSVPVHVAVFDHPTSFRHPTTWHARSYGLLAANPFGWREFSKDDNKDGSWTIPEGKSLTFRYRVFIREGDLPPDAVRDAYASYATQP
jgi:Family of unknown function (DUF6807)